jgi:hypothetical protein
MIKYRQAVKVTGDQTATSHLTQLGWKPQKAAANVKMVKVLTLFNLFMSSPHYKFLLSTLVFILTQRR